MKKNKKISFEQFSEIAIKKWKRLSEAQKRLFQERAKKLRTEFGKVKQSYYRRKVNRLREEFGPEVVSPSPRGRRVRTIDRRRRSGKTNPFMLFSKEKRDEIRRQLPPNSTVAQIAKELGKKWRQLSPEVKQSYSDRAKEAAKKADERMSKRLSKGKNPYSRKENNSQVE